MRPTALKLAGVAVAIGAAASLPIWGTRADTPAVVPPPSVVGPISPGTHSIVLSGGCFWGVQGVFEHVRGVKTAVAGYAGGPASAANYEAVSTGTTGHAESVKVSYDPSVVSTGKLLQIFFSVALDPTQHDAQGPDDGTQYRSEIWTSDAGDAALARRYIADLDRAHVFARPIATRVDPLAGFYPAEGYHQDFLVHHPDYPYIAINDIPKVEALKKLFPANYAPTPVLALPGSAS